MWHNNKSNCHFKAPVICNVIHIINQKKSNCILTQLNQLIREISQANLEKPHNQQQIKKLKRGYRMNEK